MFDLPSNLYDNAKSLLSDAGEIITGNTPSTKVSQFYKSSDFQFIKPGDLETNAVTYLTRTEQYLSDSAKSVCRMLPNGAVLYVCIGATIGKVGISTTECACNQQLNAIIPNQKINCVYLAYYLFYEKRQIISFANAPVVPIINKSDFSNIPLFIPPKNLQDSFAFIIDQIDKSKYLDFME